MRRQGGGFGFVILLVVLAIAFFIAMNNFKSVAPSALAIQKHNQARATTSAEERAQAMDPTGTATSPSSTGDAWTPAPPSRPNLDTLDKNTSQHTQAVNDAISQGNRPDS